MGTDDGVVHNRSPHPDQAIRLDRAAVQHYSVADRHVVVKNKGILILHDVTYRTVLNVCVAADADVMDITANDAVVPNAGVITDNNVSDDLRALGNVDALTDLGPLSFVLVQHFPLRIKSQR
jgi:hypothetical protein